MAAVKFTAEIVCPLTVMAFEIFTFNARPTFSPSLTVSGNESELTVTVPVVPVTWPSDPEEQPGTPREGWVQ